MCSSARCATCGKTTWRGCGQHVDSVMSGVAPEQRCQCEHRAPRAFSVGCCVADANLGQSFLPPISPAHTDAHVAGWQTEMVNGAALTSPPRPLVLDGRSIPR